MSRQTPSRAPRGSETEDDAGEIDDLVTAVLTASRVLVSVAARSLETVRNAVTLTQFRTLVVLHSRRGTNLNGLAAEVGVTASTAVRMVDKLVTAGYVTRRDNPDNRREVQLALTASGRRLVERVTEARRREIATIVAAMPTRRHGELVAALTAFAEAAHEPPAEPAPTALAW